MRTLAWILFALLAISVGLYPTLYFVLDMSSGMKSSKSIEVLNNPAWNYFFYQHITLGGLALITGWIQFSQKFRQRYMQAHRIIGKVYVLACWLSGMAGLYLAFYATGGWMAALGFGCLAIAWLISTTMAFVAIRQKRVTDHKHWMIRSYALTFAAVTLRLWLPLSFVLSLNFIVAYTMIAWLCWVPNLLVAEWLVRRARVS